MRRELPRWLVATERTFPPPPQQQQRAVRGIPAPRRVLLVDHTASLGGGEIALLNLVVELDRTRYAPLVLLGEDGALAHRLRERHVTVHVIPLDRAVGASSKDSLGFKSLLQFGRVSNAVRYCLRLYQWMRRTAPDLVHTNSLKADVLGGLAARMCGIPVLWHVRDRIADDYLPAHVAAIFRRLARVLPTRVAVNSNATLRSLSNARSHGGAVPPPDGASPARVSVVYDGTPVPPGAGIEGDGRPTPPAEIIPAPPIVGLVGRISPWKGQDVFLRAVARVAERFPDARFQIIGGALFREEEYERYVREMASRMQVRIEFTGFRDDVADLINRLTVLVHASTIGEPFGQVVIEGMAAGKPVVATSGGGVPEIVVDGSTGWLVPMKDDVAMADGICRLLADPAAAREMGRRGRARVLEHFTTRHTAQRVQGVYDQMLAGRGRRV